MNPISRVHQRFIARVTFLIGTPISLFYAAICVYGGLREKWMTLIVLILATFLGSFAVAFATWYFFLRPKRPVDGSGVDHRGPGDTPKRSDAIEYVALYRETETRISERAFVRRGLRELWLWETIIGPVAAVIALAISYSVGAAGWFLAALGAAAFFLVATPALLLVVRPALAVALVRRRPSDVIAFLPEGLAVRADEHERVYEWSRIRGLWDVGPHYVVVAGHRLGIHLPKEGLPEGALSYIRSRTGLATPASPRTPPPPPAPSSRPASR